MSQLTFSWGELPASHSASPESEVEWMTRVVNLPLHMQESLPSIAHGGLYGKMSPEFCPQTKDGISLPLSGNWSNSGMACAGECWTLSTLEFPNDGKESLLSDILETGALPPRFFLSAKAARGILRRAEKRGKELPERLRRALDQVATITKNA
jgi:hypothetical protein